MKRQNRSPFPQWSREKLRRYDAAWARVFAGRDPAEMPRFSPRRETSPQALEPLALGDWRASLILRRLASFLRPYSRPLTALSEEKARLARAEEAFLRPRTGFRLPDRAQPPTDMTPAGRLLRQQQAEQDQKAAYEKLLAGAGGDPTLAALAAQGVALAGQAQDALAHIPVK